jgi:hypothetical protein
MRPECYRTPNCSDVAVTRPILDYWGIVVRFLTGVRNFFLSKAFMQALGCNQPSFEWMMWPFSPVLKWPGHEADHIYLVSKLRIRGAGHSHPCSSEFRNM